jgi:hypothetical protein
MTASDSTSNVSTLTYPRTGKRGVPQQFPRRLYEMLESEAKLAVASPDETFVISWSASGKAFRILDVELFADTILPSYFRTKKFSSFQRNLNLVSISNPSSWMQREADRSNAGLDVHSMVLPRSEEVQTQTCTHTLLLSEEGPKCCRNFENQLLVHGVASRNDQATIAMLAAMMARSFGPYRLHLRLRGTTRQLRFILCRADFYFQLLNQSKRRTLARHGSRSTNDLYHRNKKRTQAQSQSWLEGTSAAKVDFTCLL